MNKEKVLLGLGALITADLLYHGVKYCYSLLYNGATYMKLEIIRNIPKEPSEENSVFWKQGEFFLKDQGRVATMTDVKFINKDTLVACHRAAAEVYLIKIINNTFQIIDSIVLDKEPHKYRHSDAFHPDLMSYHKGIIYLSEYGPNYCMVKVNDNKLIYINAYAGNNVNIPYHGILANDQGLYLGGCDSAIITYIKNNKNNIHLFSSKNFRKERIKTISLYNNLYILCFDIHISKGKYKQLDTRIRILKQDENNNLNIIDESIYIQDSQPDGAVVYKDYYLFTRHCSIKRCGIIGIYKIHNNKLELVKEIECENFPHGIDVNENRIVYTSYTKSAIFMIDFPKIK